MWRLLRKLGMDPPYDPGIPLLGIFPKGLKSEYYSNTCISMFRAAQFTIANYGTNLGVHQQMTGSQNYEIYIQWNSIQQ